MDNNMKWLKSKQVERTIEALEKNNMNGYYVESKEELINKVCELVDEKSKVACGGSMTLFETGVIDHLRTDRYNFLDRYKEGITQQEINEIYRGAFSCDAYFASSNAVTENGELYNVDGNGNRVAAMIFGPQRVILVCGINKIVKNVDEAIKRNKEVAGPANAKRLDRKTPCAVTGVCVNCNSPEKICREYTLIKSQGNKDRIHVIFINEEVGY